MTSYKIHYSLKRGASWIVVEAASEAEARAMYASMDDMTRFPIIRVEAV